MSAELSLAAAVLGASSRRVERTIDRTWWRGRSAVNFLSSWRTIYGPALLAAEDSLRSVSTDLLGQATQQEAASSGSAPAGAPTPTEPIRQILHLGDGQMAEVFGDLTSARRVGIWVPGVGTDEAAFLRPDSLAAKRIWNGDADLVMIEWLGYDPPDTIATAALELGHGAKEAGANLNQFVSQIKELLPEGTVVIIGGHSYGSVVAAYAASIGTAADGLVLAGSPGVSVSSAAEFSFASGPGNADNVWVVGNQADPVRVGHFADEALSAVAASVVAPLPAGLAASLLSRVVGIDNDVSWWSQMAHDPLGKGFGARRLASNDTDLRGVVTGANHRYAEPGSVSLEGLRAAFRAPM